MVNKADCEFVKFSKDTRKFIVREDLSPESRGYILHAFDTEIDARKYMAWGVR